MVIKFYLPSWFGPLFWPVQEQGLVYFFNCNPVVLTVDMRKPSVQ